MSPTRKPSSVAGLRRGVGAATPPAGQTDDLPDSALLPAADYIRDVAAELEQRRPPRPEKPVRFTLDLDRDRHQFLKEHAVGIGVDASQVMRALLDELRDDADLQGRIWHRIWQPR